MELNASRTFCILALLAAYFWSTRRSPESQDTANQSVGTSQYPEAKAPKDSARFPYFGLITKSGQVFCGSVLISPDVILTSSSCLEVSSALLSVAIHNETRSMSSIKRSGGIALAKLNTPVDNVVTPPYGEIPNDTDLLLAIGYGKDSPSGTYSNALQGAMATAMTNAACTSQLGESIPENYMCGYSGGYGPCQGDVGGPLLFEGESEEDDIVVGIITAHYCCSNEYKPDVYYRMSSYKQWIDENKDNW